MSEISFEIKKQYGVIGTGIRGWQKEVNLVSWNKRKPKVDIREWDEFHEKMGKGLTLDKEEIANLLSALSQIDLTEIE